MSFWDTLKTLPRYKSYHLIDHNKEFCVNLFRTGSTRIFVDVTWFVNGYHKTHSEYASENDSSIESELEQAAISFHADKGYYPHSELVPVPDKQDFKTLEQQAKARSIP